MLTLEFKDEELWDEVHECFVNVKERKIVLEHSLVSISKWESKWYKPFIDDYNKKTLEETIDYIRCMTITQNVPDYTFNRLTNEHIEQVNKYIEDPMTATTFVEIPGSRGSGGGQFLTNELIYSRMIAFNIPFECQKWHLNRLLTLIRVCDEENKKANSNGKGKAPSADAMRRRAELNAARRRKLNSKG